jgi:hypothetical protein
MANPNTTNPVEGATKFTEDFQEGAGGVHRQSILKKNTSVKHTGSIGGGEAESINSVFYTPIPTQGNPTDTLANRFNAWRKVLKDFINYFREVQSSYENRAKGITKISQTLSTTIHPSEFVKSGGILETNTILRDFQKELYVDNENNAKIVSEIISNLNSLRTDLSFKIKEIKALAPDFKNNVEKEKELTRKEVIKLTEALTGLDSGSQSSTDPYLVKLGLQKQLRRQIDEESYLHKAYINIENSGRELEKIVVAEIQKIFEIYIKLIKHESERQSDFAQRLSTSTLQLPADHEWSAFLERDSNIGGSSVPLRNFDDIEYPGYQHPAVLEVRVGLMERKSKYLKSYAPGWYVLSSTHLHEFKTSERTRDPNPVMSLYLPQATLGKHSEPSATSHKFVLKGRQSGLHLEHSWVFRAETHAAMLEWYTDIKKLTEVSGAERNAFVSGAVHGRQGSVDTARGEEFGGDDYGLDNDEADEVPYSTEPSALEVPIETKNKRPEGGRFPSDINVNRATTDVAATSGDSNPSVIGAAGALPGNYGRPRSGSQSSTWSYDEKHPVHNTMEDEEDDFLPVGAEVSPAVERRMSVRHDYTENEALARNQSAATRRGPPSRKPTASYGIDPITGLPDTGMGSSAGNLSNIDWNNVIAANENKPSSPTFTRKPPSRKPTAGYGIDPITGHHEYPVEPSISENQPTRTVEG